MAAAPLRIAGRSVRAVNDRTPLPATAGASRKSKRSVGASIEHVQAQLVDFYQQKTERQEARINRESSERIAAPTGRAG